jgi:hypothetical protein
MNVGSLETTNLILGILAAVSVVEVALLIGFSVAAYRLYTEAMRAIREIEGRQIAPLVAKVNALMLRVDQILVDVNNITARVTSRTERVDAAIDNTMDRLDSATGRVRRSMSSQVNRAVTIVRTARAIIADVLHNGRRASGRPSEHA